MKINKNQLILDRPCVIICILNCLGLSSSVQLLFSFPTSSNNLSNLFLYVFAFDWLRIICLNTYSGESLLMSQSVNFVNFS